MLRDRGRGWPRDTVLSLPCRQAGPLVGSARPASHHRHAVSEFGSYRRRRGGLAVPAPSLSPRSQRHAALQGALAVHGGVPRMFSGQSAGGNARRIQPRRRQPVLGEPRQPLLPDGVQAGRPTHRPGSEELHRRTDAEVPDLHAVSAAGSARVHRPGPRAYPPRAGDAQEGGAALGRLHRHLRRRPHGRGLYRRRSCHSSLLLRHGGSRR